MNDSPLKKKTEPEITKIVITGGPCAGKSTAISWVQNAFTQMGYTVLFVPETATELITGGVAPWSCGSVAGDSCKEEFVYLVNLLERGN